MANAAGLLVALGDPTRRRVLETLRAGPRSVSDITAALPVTQSAVSQHLRVLREAGLVSERRQGNRRLYRVEPDALTALRAYFDSFWDEALGAFAELAEGQPSPQAQQPADQPTDHPTGQPTGRPTVDHEEIA